MMIFLNIPTQNRGVSLKSIRDVEELTSFLGSSFGNKPNMYFISTNIHIRKKSLQSDSNQRPTDYKSVALPAELWRRLRGLF